MQTPSGPAAPDRIRVPVADDHPLMRIGVVSVLEQDPLLEVVGQAKDGREAVKLAQELEPHVVMMDLDMPGVGGLEATRALPECCPMASVLILTVMDHEARAVLVSEQIISTYSRNRRPPATMEHVVVTKPPGQPCAPTRRPAASGINSVWRNQSPAAMLKTMPLAPAAPKDSS